MGDWVIRTAGQLDVNDIILYNGREDVVMGYSRLYPKRVGLGLWRAGHVVVREGDRFQVSPGVVGNPKYDQMIENIKGVAESRYTDYDTEVSAEPLPQRRTYGWGQKRRRE